MSQQYSERRKLERAERADNRCLVCWNPGEWPYTTRCVHQQSHKGDHKDGKGRTIPNLGPEQGSE